MYTCNFFIKHFSTLPETFLRYKTNILFLAFNHGKESVSSKHVVRLLNKTVSKKEKKEFSVKWINN